MDMLSQTHSDLCVSVCVYASMLVCVFGLSRLNPASLGSLTTSPSHRLTDSQSEREREAESKGKRERERLGRDLVRIRKEKKKQRKREREGRSSPQQSPTAPSVVTENCSGTSLSFTPPPLFLPLFSFGFALFLFPSLFSPLLNSLKESSIQYSTYENKQLATNEI